MALLLAGLTAAAAQPHPRVALLTFQNLSRATDEIALESPVFHPSKIPLLGKDQQGNTKFGFSKIMADRFAELARTQLEHVLVSMGDLDIIERTRLDALQSELDLNSARGGDREGRELLAKNHGVDFLVFGQVLEVWNRSSVFEGYGLTRRVDQTFAIVSLRVVQMAPERIVFAAQEQGAVELVTTPSKTIRHSDPAAEAIRVAVNRFSDSLDFRKAFVTNLDEANRLEILGPNQVLVPIKSQPRDAMVELDGTYLGVTPLKTKLRLNGTHNLRFTKPGFNPWEGKLKVDANSFVQVELEAKP